jgi:uncharacterized protein (DUF983 family)
VSVTRIQIVTRGLGNTCPNCGEAIHAKRGTRFQVEESCPRCGLVIDRGEGAFLGPLVVNFSVTVFGFVLPLVVLCANHFLNSTATYLLAGGAALVLPLLFYRLSWSWWVMLYYFVLADNLPANRGDRPEDDE